MKKSIFLNFLIFAKSVQSMMISSGDLSIVQENVFNYYMLYWSNLKSKLVYQSSYSMRIILHIGHMWQEDRVEIFKKHIKIHQLTSNNPGKI